jgi:hypothetical protein
MVNQDLGHPRAVMFVGGDIHTGALYEIAVTDPAFTALCLISSGVAQARGHIVGLKLDDDHAVAERALEAADYALAKEGLRRPYCDLFIENAARLMTK